MKIYIVLMFILIGAVAPVYGMTSATRAGASRGQSYARSKFTSKFLSESFLSKLSAYALQFWKILSDPKAHYSRIGKLQKEAGKKGQQEASKLDESKLEESDPEEDESELEEEDESRLEEEEEE